jgi:hypothetical protein
MTFQEILWGPLGQRLAWTLLHFLWQGLLIAAGVAALGWLFSRAQARGRYAVALAGLVLMASCPLITFGVLEISAPRPVALAPAPELGEPAPRPPEAVESPAADAAAPLPAASPDVGAPEPSSAPIPEPTPAEPDWRTLLAGRAVAIQPYAVLAWLAGVVALSVRVCWACAAWPAAACRLRRNWPPAPPGWPSDWVCRRRRGSSCRRGSARRCSSDSGGR